MTFQKMLEIMESEYGIRTMQELDEAIRKQNGVNIGMFAGAYERRNDAEKRDSA